jgi:hypothetical protein
MGKSIDKNAQKPRRTRTKASVASHSSRARQAKDQTMAGSNPSSERFVEDLLIRGEAAKPTQEGKLPLDATHAITKENPDGTVEVKRVRYKTF